MSDQFESREAKVELFLNKQLHIDEASPACDLQRYLFYRSE